MQVEIFLLLWGALLSFLVPHVYLSAKGRGRYWGIFSGFLLFILSFAMFLSPIEIRTGYIETVIDANTTQVTYTYATPSVPTFADISLTNIFALLLGVFGLYMIITNGLALMSRR